MQEEEKATQEQGKNVVGVFFILRCVQICSLLQHCCMGMDREQQPKLQSHLSTRSHSLIQSRVHQLSILIECQASRRSHSPLHDLSIDAIVDRWPA